MDELEARGYFNDDMQYTSMSTATDCATQNFLDYLQSTVSSYIELISFTFADNSPHVQCKCKSSSLSKSKKKRIMIVRSGW